MQSNALKAERLPIAANSTVSQRIAEPDLAHARTLVARGDDMAASQAYLALLARDPTHFQCLTELAGLAFAGGYRSAARTAYEQAVSLHPREAIGHVNLANVLLAEREIKAAREHFELALQCDPDFYPAHQGLAGILADAGDPRADEHRDRGFQGRAVVRKPFRGVGKAKKVLLLVSARGGNIPTEQWLNDRHYDVTAIYAEYHETSAILPAHDLIFNAIGDADLCADALKQAAAICARSRRPVVNRPEQVMGTGRAGTSERLAGIAGLRVPRVETLSIAAIRRRQEIAFPVLIRRPGYHTGQYFYRVETRSDLEMTLDQFDALGADDLLLINYMDARGSDGLSRKFRMMFIGGRPYPLHLAISRDWKVHYFTAAMAEDASFREEEQRFLDDPAGVIGKAGMTALRQVASKLGLDYAGIDFGLSNDGRILLFEANATMVLIPPSPDPIWNYRRPAITAAFEAVRTMLRQRLGQSS